MKSISFLLSLIYSLTAFSQGSSCSNAYVLPLDAVCRNYTVSSTTSSCIFCTMTGYTGNNGHVTYFKFTTDDISQCVLLDITSSVAVTMELVLYEACSGGIPSPTGGLYNQGMCMNTGSGLWAQNLFDNLDPSTTYYLKVRTAGGFTGDIQVCGKYYTPPNNTCAGATSISSNTTTSDNNACHRPETVVPPTQLCAVTLENTAWYTYVIQATGNSTITIDSIACNNGNGNNNNGFQIGFFSGNCGSLTPITCSSGAGGTVQATATGLTGGTRIYVGVDGYSGSNCKYKISATNAYPLPISLKQFVVWKAGTKNIAKWITTQEYHNAYFEIQRSDDGIHFTELGRVAGEMSSSIEKEYTFEDNYPLLRGIYRLKQVDRDGKVFYSKIIEVLRSDMAGLSILPIPIVTDLLHLSIRATRPVRSQIRIVDMQGKVLATDWVYCNQGVTNFEKSLPSLPGGKYVVVLTGEKERVVQYFSKLSQ